MTGSSGPSWPALARWLGGALVALLAWFGLVVIEDVTEASHRITLLEREQTYLSRSVRELVKLHTSTQHGIGVPPNVGNSTSGAGVER
jgi:Tfp pilus assembly protein PilN